MIYSTKFYYQHIIYNNNYNKYINPIKIIIMKSAPSIHAFIYIYR